MEENENERDQVHNPFTNSQKYLDKIKKSHVHSWMKFFVMYRIFNFVKTQEMLIFYLIDSTYHLRIYLSYPDPESEALISSLKNTRW